MKNKKLLIICCCIVLIGLGVAAFSAQPTMEEQLKPYYDIVERINSENDFGVLGELVIVEDALIDEIANKSITISTFEKQLTNAINQRDIELSSSLSEENAPLQKIVIENVVEENNAPRELPDELYTQEGSGLCGSGLGRYHVYVTNWVNSPSGSPSDLQYLRNEEAGYYILGTYPQFRGEIGASYSFPTSKKCKVIYTGYIYTTNTVRYAGAVDVISNYTL